MYGVLAVIFLVTGVADLLNEGWGEAWLPLLPCAGAVGLSAYWVRHQRTLGDASDEMS